MNTFIRQNLVLRKIRQEDCQLISNAFQEQGWIKPVEQYEKYLSFQEAGLRDIIIAEINGNFAGYLTILWKSDYQIFKEKGIPEIVDFNVLKKYQRNGIGSLLMDEAEKRISQVSTYAGIGFGVTKDYGAAQILYVKRNYIPDGNGLVKNSKSLQYGDQVTIGDDLVFCLIKEL